MEKKIERALAIAGIVGVGTAASGCDVELAGQSEASHEPTVERTTADQTIEYQESPHDKDIPLEQEGGASVGQGISVTVTEAE